jgi:hypothetical protein
MLGMKIAHGVDPSKGVRNRAPAPRHQRWTEGEAVRLVKAAWRSGYRGLACIIAIAWDTSFSPVDVRTLAARHRSQANNGGLMFDRRDEGRAKTGKAAIGTISRRTERLITATSLHSAPIFIRMPSYSGIDPAIPIARTRWLMTSARYARRYSRGTNGALWICVGRGRSKPSLAVPKALP